MQNCFTLCGTTIAALALLTATSAMAQTTAAPVPQTASAWARSVKITAIDVPETDVSELLGLSMWRFDIVGPKPAHEIKMILEAQESGKAPHSLAEISVSPATGWPIDHHLSVFVGQYPLYDTLGVPTKARYQVRVGGFKYAPLSERGSSSHSGVYDNPLSEMATTSSGSPAQQPDGSFVLSSGTGNSTPPGHAALVFRVEEQTY